MVGEVVDGEVFFVDLLFGRIKRFGVVEEMFVSVFLKIFDKGRLVWFKYN